MPLQHAPREHPEYVLGHSADELDRLIDQARFLGELTEHLLGLAGLQPGMRVLDVGCGAGDVTFLAARIVGPDGWVTGVDTAAGAVDVARARALQAELANVEFLVGDATELLLGEPVDAVIGRLVLMYFAEPAAVLRHLMRSVRPGGVVAFQELHAQATASQPPCPTYDIAVDRVRRTLAAAGSDPQAGLGLWHTFRDAGLTDPRLLQTARVEAGAGSAAYGQVAQITRTLLPLMERTGVATAAEVDVDTLADRLRAEAVRHDAVLVFPPLIGAWARTPAA